MVFVLDDGEDFVGLVFVRLLLVVTSTPLDTAAPSSFIKSAQALVMGVGKDDDAEAGVAAALLRLTRTPAP